jgi:hypothetical protein
MFSYKIFRTESDVLLAISDASILGKIFEEKGMQLEVPEDFYSGSKCSKAYAVKLIKSATIINAVGDNIISLMIEKKLIEKDKILKIGGVPHAQIVSVE